MRTLKDILIVTLLMILVFMTCVQEGDILKLRHRVFMLEGGLIQTVQFVKDSVEDINHLRGGLMQALKFIESNAKSINSPQGGLGSVKGGLGLNHFRSCTAALHVTKPNAIGPIILGTEVTGGTGVFMSDNVLLTAKHVVEDRINNAGVEVIGPNGVTYTVMEILEDFDDDLAIVILRDRRGPWMELGPSPSLGDEVICIGTPLISNDQLIITWGRVSSEKYLNTFIYDGFCWGGCSGGPVIVDGKLVGITESRLNRTSSLGFAVPLNRLDPDLMARIR